MAFKDFYIDVAVDVKNIDFLNCVFEGYDHLCVVSTVDRRGGIVRLRGFGKRGPLRRILKGLPFKTEIIAESPESDV